MLPVFDAAAHERLLARAIRAEQRLHDVRARQERSDQAAQQLQLALKDVAPKVDEVLGEVQRRVNDAVVGSMSDLLTKLVQHVMDDDTRRIACENDVDGRGLASIRFLMEREDGSREDILSGNGGSVANVVSTGLRLIAVHRSPSMRKLLVLDEPDCWLSPDRVGAFVQILHKAALQCEDMQVLMITHHDLDAALLADVGLVRFERTAAGIRAYSRVVRPARGRAIARVRLQNWRSHHDTEIEIGMGLTVVSGANNLGKSAMVEALRALCYGTVRADVIAHGQRQARLRVWLADGRCIDVERNKTSPVHVRRLLDAQGNVQCEDFAAGREALLPPWHDEAVGVRAVEGIEVHVADQKRPVFLLDLPATQQVALLSIGQEAQRLSVIMQRWRDLRRQWQAQLRAAQQEAEHLRRCLQKVPLEQEALSGQREQMALASERIQQARARIERMREVLQLVQRLRGVESLALAAPSLPNMGSDLQVRAAVLRSLRSLAPCAGLEAPQVAALPVLFSEQWLQRSQALAAARRMHELAARLKSVLEHAVLQLPALPAPPQLRDRHHALESLQMLIEEGRTLAAQLRRSEKELEELAHEKKDIESTLGVCPLCEQHFAVEHEHV